MSKTTERHERRRHEMVDRQIAARGIRDDRLLQAMRSVPREYFVAEEMVEFAHEDSALPIEARQTISQPYIVALMIEALRLEPHDRVLEVGAGSGYAAAVLGQLAEEIFAIERHRSLAEAAQRTLERLGYDNVHVFHGDGTLGWEDEAPFDAILVSAGGAQVPTALKEQLAPGGRMVMPVGEHGQVQELRLFEKGVQGELAERSLGAVRSFPSSGAWREIPLAGRRPADPTNPPRTRRGPGAHPILPVNPDPRTEPAEGARAGRR